MQSFIYDFKFTTQLVKPYYTQELWINTAAVLQVGVVEEDTVGLKSSAMRIKTYA